MSESASDPTPLFLEGRGFKSVPKSVAYGYTASGYGFVQDMPYAYIQEFTRTSMAGKIRRFRGGYMSFWQGISKSLPIQVLCNTEVIAIRRHSSIIDLDVEEKGSLRSLEFDKLIISGAFPFKYGKTYRSPSLTSAGLKLKLQTVIFIRLYTECVFLSLQILEMRSWISLILRSNCSVK